MKKDRNEICGGVDVIVRFHDIRRLRELDRAIFSLAMQDYRPLHIHLCVQRFSEAEIEATRSHVLPILSIEGSPSLYIHNFCENTPADARSELINLGIANSNHRYLAFLDYDDIVYPEAYRLLIEQIIRSDSAICFGRVCIKEISNYVHFDCAESKSFPFNGSTVLELMQQNFCPIHSFVIDTSAVPRHCLFFEPSMNRNEDYDFLLRLVAQSRADFSMIHKLIGEYYVKRDGSNTISTEYAVTPESAKAWEDAEAFIEGRRRITLVSKDVQRSIGIANPMTQLSIRQILDLHIDRQS